MMQCNGHWASHLHAIVHSVSLSAAAALRLFSANFLGSDCEWLCLERKRSDRRTTCLAASLFACTCATARDSFVVCSFFRMTLARNFELRAQTLKDFVLIPKSTVLELCNCQQHISYFIFLNYITENVGIVSL